MSEPFDFEAFKEQDRLAMFEEHPLVTSPDGRIKISYESYEVRNGQWINIPHMYEAEGGRILFKPSSSLIDGQHEWAADGTFTLCLREFPDGGSSLILEFDIEQMTVRLHGEEQWSPIERASTIANREFSRIKKARREAYDAQLAQITPMMRFKEFLYDTYWSSPGRKALAVFIGFMVIVLIDFAMDFVGLMRILVRFLSNL